MSLPVFFSLTKIAVHGRFPRGDRTTLRRLCLQAGVDCRVTGPGATRSLFLATTDALAAVREPGSLSRVWLGVPKGSEKRRALLALGLLAYSVFDYGARETLRGIPESRAAASRGRPRTGRALSPLDLPG